MLTPSQNIPIRNRMTVNAATERGYRRVLTGYACYRLLRHPAGYQCFKAGNVLAIQDAWNWINGDDTVELLKIKLNSAPARSSAN